MGRRRPSSKGARSGQKGSRGGSGGRFQDEYARRAKREGFPARSVYKLEEIDKKIRLLKQGQSVLDLGASPGSWTLYAAQKVGKNGRVIGLDLKPLRAEVPANAEFRVGDVREETVDSLQGPFDVVLSDMAPDTTGHRDLDQYRSYELWKAALDLAAATLVVGGSFVGKIFQGPEFEQARVDLRAVFEKSRIVRPKAVRDVSYEVFLVGERRRAADPESEDP